MSNKITVSIPEIFSFISHPELAIKALNQAEKGYTERKTVAYDFRETKKVCATAISVLIAFFKDRKLNRGMASDLLWPSDTQCRDALVSYGVRRRVNNTLETGECFSPIPVQKVTDSIVANEVAKQTVQTCSTFLYGKEVRIRELYSVLIEMMANTNNHAGSSSSPRNWFMFINKHENDTHKAVSFVFADLGVGIYNSLPVMQNLSTNPIPIFDDQKTNRRFKEIFEITQRLMRGEIKSSTGKRERGKGIPLLSKIAKEGHFSDFKLWANDAYVDFAKNEQYLMHEHFSGSLFYFQITEPR